MKKIKDDAMEYPPRPNHYNAPVPNCPTNYIVANMKKT